MDITERKQHERELRRYRTLIETMPDPAYALDREGSYTLVNQAYVDQIGYDRTELLDSHISHVLDEEALQRGQAIVETLLDTDETASERYEQTVELASGERVTCIVHQTLIYEDGEWHGSVGTVRPESRDWPEYV
ncbi:MAG: PAS domain-containing protein [Halobacteriales archaeon]|nr:PAS domain-containing protein [Halobacteriales archaeon]